MAKIELNPLTSGYNINQVNVNFDAIEQEFKNKVVYRDEASPMGKELDLNGFKIINVAEGDNVKDAATLGQVQAIVRDASGLVATFRHTATATAGQTVVNTSFEYQPSGNNLRVYVNGLLTNPGVDYEETSTTTVTFLTPLELGDEIVFIIGDLVSQVDVDPLIRPELAAPSGAGTVGYLPEGTGAVPATVQNKLREIVSVKDFGAVGDGVTDDTAALQKAIDYLASVGGGSLLLPSGQTFGITGTVYVKSNVHLVGEGRPVIRAISAFEGAMVQFGFTTGAIVDADTDLCNNASIEGVEIDGDYLVTGKDWDPGDTVAASLDSGLIYVWRNCTHIRIENCEVHSAECGLISAEDGADYLIVRRNEVHDATTFSAATQFINLMDIDGPENAIIEGNYGYNLLQSGYSPASWGYALRLHATDCAIVQGNRLTTGYHNILVDGRKNLIQGNNLSGSQQTGIILYQNAFLCRYNVVIGNYVDCGNRPIREDDAGFTGRVEQNVIAFNTCINSNFNIDTEGRGTVVFGNRVFSDAGSTAYATVNIFPISGADATSTLRSDVYTPATINNTNNTSSTTISDVIFSRSGDVVHFAGKATTTLAAPGVFEFRFTPPIASNFDSDADACGSASDNFSSYGNVAALTTGSPRFLRVQGTATSSGAKTIRFSGMYRIK